MKTESTDSVLAEEAVQNSEEKYRTAFAQAAVGLALTDLQGRFVQINEAYSRITGYPVEELLATDLYAITHPDDQPRKRDLIRQMVAGDIPSFVIEKRYIRKDGSIVWVQNSLSLVRDAQGQPANLIALTQDITERIQIAEALREASERTTDILESITDAFFVLDNQWRFTYLNNQAERLLQYTREEMLGRNIWEVFPAAVGGDFYRHYHHAVENQVAVSFEAFSESLFTWREVRAYPTARGLSIYFHDINDRKIAEAARDQAVVAQTRLAETNRLLLDSTGDGIYGIDREGRFTLVNRAAAQILGYTPQQMLGQNGHALIHHSRPDGAPYPEDQCPIFRAIRSGQGARVEDEVFWRQDGTAVPVAYSAAPILEQGHVQGAVVTFADISERKTLDQERERLLEREHRIAERLQQALQPMLPSVVPGLELADFYRPALEEAGVGGDFSDVFAADKGITYLVVGDLSGKGLAAASQVATVRNMLRFALYNGRTLAGPVASLNATLADHNLLDGFCTLFVGRYDAQTRKLTYVNCGQDAGLLLRAATGQIEELAATGPVLGGFSEAKFEEQTITLEAGDTLALFTDGLTEAGPSRAAMLTGDGVAALVQAQSDRSSAQKTVSQIMAGVDTYAQSGVRDDQCLLVGIVSGAQNPAAA